MTITRREQIAAETGSNYEWPIDSGLTETSTDFEFTGNRSSSQNTTFELGVFTPYSKFRAGFFFLFDAVLDDTPSELDYHYLLRFTGPLDAIYALAYYGYEGVIGWYTEAAGIMTNKVNSYHLGLNESQVFRHVGVYCDNGNQLTVYIDGVVVLSIVPPTFSRMEIGGADNGAWSSWYADDFYLDELTDEVDHCPPTVRFVPSFPSADGADVAWAASRSGTKWQEIEEVPIALGDYLYVDAADLKTTSEGSDIVFDETLYDFDAVIVCGVLIAEAGLPEVRLIARDSTPVYANGADQIVDTDYALYQERFLVQPDTTAWNITDFNAMQFGVESRGDYLL